MLPSRRTIRPLKYEVNGFAASGAHGNGKNREVNDNLPRLQTIVDREAEVKYNLWSRKSMQGSKLRSPHHICPAMRHTVRVNGG